MYNKLSINSIGAIATFIGAVRNTTNGKRVVKPDFESYEKMVLTEFQNIFVWKKEFFEDDEV